MFDIINRELRLPLNLNDNQIYPDMTHLLVESDGWTEMSFFLFQTGACRRMYPVLDIQEQQSADVLLDITEKLQVIEQRGSRKPSGLSRITDQHATTAYKKIQFVLLLRKETSMRKQIGARDDATPGILKPSFKLACETLESSYMFS